MDTPLSLQQGGLLKCQRCSDRKKVALKPVLGLEFVHPFKGELPVPWNLDESGLQTETVHLVFHIRVDRVKSFILCYVPLAKTGDAKL